MRIRRLLVATVAMAGASAALAGPASAATTTTTYQSSAAEHTTTYARLVGPVVVDRKDHRVAYVAAVYRCFGEGHLWVSVKQVKDRSKDPRLAAEGSSQISAAWSDSHRNTVTCDGRKHLQVFTVDQTEPYSETSTDPKSSKYGPLKKGYGYVQFCLFDANNTKAPYSQMKFRHVVVPKRHHHHHHH